ncbi:MAG: hypothetical protein JO301_00860 [Chitinophagaceae bacterium]|nr:hypothetical protein [Chitinophagaceae bacterium]
MKRYALILLLFAAACQTHTETSADKPKTIIISNDTIPETRSSVNRAPVASYSEAVKDELNDWKFAVAAYETPLTFRFILRMQYKELRISDSLKIPNFGMQPKLEIRKGSEPLSCIIGFFDTKGRFKEYKKAAIKNEQLKLTTLNNYYVGSYRTPVH